MEEILYHLHLQLEGAHVPITRDFVVPEDISLSQLHEVIQAVMGWTDDHMHQFNTRDQRVPAHSPVGDFDGDEHDGEKAICLSEMLHDGCKKLIYEYDFGDSWTHRLTVRSFAYKKPVPHLIHCLKAVGACPPENVGGVWGYEQFCDDVHDPKNRSNGDLPDWVSGIAGTPEADKWPDRVSVDDINAKLHKMKYVPTEDIPADYLDDVDMADDDGLTDEDGASAASAQPDILSFPGLAGKSPSEAVQQEHFSFILNQLCAPVLISPGTLKKDLTEQLGDMRDICILGWNFSFGSKSVKESMNLLKRWLTLRSPTYLEDQFVLYSVERVIGMRRDLFPNDDLSVLDADFKVKGDSIAVKCQFMKENIAESIKAMLAQSPQEVEDMMAKIKAGLLTEDDQNANQAPAAKTKKKKK